MIRALARLAFLSPAAVCLAVPAAAQDWYADDYQTCTGGSTVEIVVCLAGLTAEWDARLNAAYQTLMDDLVEDRKTALRDVQRQWIAFRDANCGWYAGGEGSIARIEAAECLRVTTMQRAIELENLAREG